MNNEQLELIDSYNRMKSSSLYLLAQDAKAECINQGKSKEEIRNLVFRQLCMTAGWYGAHGPEDFPISLDVFIYLRGKVEDKSSQLFQQFRRLFTKYDDYDISDLLKAISDALVNWHDPTDVVAITMCTAIHVLSNAISEQSRDMWLMHLMQGTVIDNEQTNPDGVNNCSLLWAFTAVYLNFEERLKRIVDNLIAEAEG